MGEPIDRTRRTYDAIAATYAKRTGRIYPELLAEIATLQNRLPAGSLVADIGCGPGRDIGLMRERGLRAIGFDLSFGQLRVGGLPGVAQADMRAIPLRDRAVDAIWCQAALLHIPHRTVPVVLAEFARIVRPGGVLDLEVDEGDGERWEIATQYDSQWRRWFTYHREPELTRSLAVAGFSTTAVSRHPGSRNWLRIRAERSRN